MDKHPDFDATRAGDLDFNLFSMNLYFAFFLISTVDFGKSQPSLGRELERTPSGEVVKS